MSVSKNVKHILETLDKVDTLEGKYKIWTLGPWTPLGTFT